MLRHVLFSARAGQSLRVVLATAGVLLLSVSAVFAAWNVIDPNDSSVVEWESQGILRFDTSPTGNVNCGFGSCEDLTTGWVASATIPEPTAADEPALAFRVQVVAPLTSDHIGLAASLDCDGGGDRGTGDVEVCYKPNSDQVILTTFETPPTYSCQSGTVLSNVLGQRIGSDAEWAVPLAALPAQCQHKVGVRLVSYGIGCAAGGCFWPREADTMLLRGWDIDLAVPVSATLTIEGPEDMDLDLTWTPTAQTDQYDVMRSTQPYDGYASLVLVPDPDTGYLDQKVEDDPVDGYYYQVRSTLDGVQTVDLSNTVGWVKFSLVPGSE